MIENYSGDMDLTQFTGRVDLIMKAMEPTRSLSKEKSPSQDTRYMTPQYKASEKTTNSLSPDRRI